MCMFIKAKMRLLIRFVKGCLFRCEVGIDFERVFGIVKSLL